MEWDREWEVNWKWTGVEKLEGYSSLEDKSGTLRRHWWVSELQKGDIFSDLSITNKAMIWIKVGTESSGERQNGAREQSQEEKKENRKIALINIGLHGLYLCWRENDRVSLEFLYKLLT